MASSRILIIGAGPAGMAAALVLQMNGIDCLVVDKCRFPRTKACGGLVTEKSMALLECLLPFEDIRSNALRLDKIRMTYRNDVAFGFQCDSAFYTITREYLDNALVARYKRMGGKIIEDCRCISVNQDNRTIETTFGSQRYDELIVANGANGDVLLGKRERPVARGMGIVSFVQLKDLAPDCIYIDLGYVERGYSWVFPQINGSSNVGFAGTMSDKKSYELARDNLQKRYGITFEEIDFGTIPICRRPVFRQGEHIYFAGSSGNLVDALTGEGIYLALFSGMCVGQLLAKAVSEEDYYRMTRSMSSCVKGGIFSSDLLWKYKLLPILARIAPYLSKLDAHITNHLISNYDYNHYNVLLSPFICYAGGKPRKNGYILMNCGDDTHGEQQIR